MNTITPISESVQKKVVDEVDRYVAIASSLYKTSFKSIDVVFNIKGRTAGMYRTYYEKNKTVATTFQRMITKRQCQIRFNPWLFSKYPEDSWNNTIPHEVAHYISDCLFGLHKIKPHGNEWKNIMNDFGAEPIVRGDYSLEGIPVRKTTVFNYACDCREVPLTGIRHKKIQRGQQDYRCRDCLKVLVYQEK